MYHYFPENAIYRILFMVMVSVNQNLWSRFQENLHFHFWNPSGGFVFMELECLYSWAVT
jgi:hypothetical protein